MNRTPVIEREAMCDYISSAGVCQAPGIWQFGVSTTRFCTKHFSRIANEMTNDKASALIDALEREKMLTETGSLGRFCEEVVVDGMAKELGVNL